MKANELRIGNIVFDTVGRCNTYVNIIAPWKEDPNEWVVSTSNMPPLFNSSVEPIPLTEEWLKRLGFEKLTYKSKGFKSDSYSYTGGPSLIVHFDGVRLSVNFWQGNEKRYVHQLQNLYFALTGEELTIKE